MILSYWTATTYEGGFGGVYAMTEEDCLNQIKIFTEKGGRFGPPYKTEIEYINNFDLLMQIYGYVLQDDGSYRPGVKMVGRQ